MSDSAPPPLPSSPGPPGSETNHALANAALVAVCLLFAFGLVWTAWLSDDAYITFRSMDHFVHGRGLGWNVAERVQAFTNPLWLLLLAPFYGLTGSAYWVALVAGAVGTTWAITWLVRSASCRAAAALGVLVLAGSKAFLEYSTSGLENPLLHVAFVGTVLAFLNVADPVKRAGYVAFGSSIAFLTRPDALLLTGVLCVAAWLAAPSLRTTGRMFLGWLPALAWEAFSVIYFGTWLPNTAIAKLGGDLPQEEVLQQGLAYLGNSLRWDPLTLTAIAVALLAYVPWPGRGRGREAVVALALSLQLVYVVKVGGDFMSGRFLTGPLVVAVLLLVRLRPSRNALLVGAVAAAGLATYHDRSPWRPRPATLAFMDAEDPSGVTDERAVYFGYTGLVSAGHPAWGRLADGAAYPPAVKAHADYESGERVIVERRIGMLGFFAPPDLHIIDGLGLADPLLARLPLTGLSGGPLFRHRVDALGRFWRIGHLRRDPPSGYAQSVETDGNKLKDPALARYYDAVRSLTRAPVWSPERWRVLLSFHRGAYREDLAEWRRGQPERELRRRTE